MPIVDNFNYQFIPEVTEISNGTMSSYDKMKLDGINLDDIDYIYSNLEDIKEYMVPQFIYGIKIDPTISDPNNAVTYTDDSVGFIPLSVNQTTGECNYGSWKNIIENVFGIAPCLMKKDGTIVTYLNPNDYSKSIEGHSIDIESGDFGQVVIRFKRLYYKITVDGDKLWFRISNKKTDSTWIDTAFSAEDGIGTSKKEMFISAYECVQKNNILQSISNKNPNSKLSFEEVEEYSNFGVFNMMNIVRKQFVMLLGYMVTKSIDLEGNIGIGNISNKTINTGSMNTKGLFYGNNSGTTGVKLFGIENLWGNQLKYMHGIIQKLTYVLNHETGITDPEQHIYIKASYPYDNIDDFDDMGKVVPNRSGFISSIKMVTEYAYMPENLDGATNSYYKSYFKNGESTNTSDKHYGIYGGGPLYEDKSGPEFLILAYLDKETTEVTTHLIY